jgi:LEA14-like dessication related protein
MKSFVLIFSLVASMIARAQEDDPYLVKTKDFHVNHFSLKQIDLGITSVIYNPYKVKVSLDEILIDVFINGKKLGTITEAAEIVKIRKKSAFDLPLNINVKTSSTVKTFFTEGAKLVLSGKKIGVDFRGHVKLKAIGFVPIKVKIDQTEYFTMKDILKSDDAPTKIDTKDLQLTKP